MSKSTSCLLGVRGKGQESIAKVDKYYYNSDVRFCGSKNEITSVTWCQLHRLIARIFHLPYSPANAPARTRIPPVPASPRSWSAMFLMDLVDDVEAATEAFFVFVVWIGSVGDGFQLHSPFWLTLRLFRAPAPDACADPLEELIVLDVVPNAIPDAVVEGIQVVVEVIEMESLETVELDDGVDVPASWELAPFLATAVAITTSRKASDHSWEM